MRALPIPLLAALFAAGVLLVGCGPPADPAVTAPEKKPARARETGGPVALKVLAPGGGVLKGRVTLKGPRPDTDRMSADLRAQMAKNPDKEMCLMGTPEELAQQAWKIDERGHVGDVFVWVLPGDGQVFGFDAGKKTWPDTVAIDQPHCAFVPHALALFPSYRDPATNKLVPTGQKFVVKNSSTGTHNANLNSPDGKNPSGNNTLGPGKELEVKGWQASSTPTGISCNYHPWMSAVVRVFDNPYYALTRPDGTYEITNLPAAGTVRVVAWHERAKYLTQNGAKGEEFELGGEVVRDFAVEVK